MSEFDTLTDAELIAALRAGDDAAFTEVYDRYGERVYSYALNVTGSEETAAAVTLQVFGQAAESLRGRQEPEGVRPWLFSLARQQVKASGRDVAVTRDTGSGDGIRREVLEATDDLGARDRHVMNLHLVVGLEGDDLAMAMGVDEANLDELVSRVRRRVEGILGALLVARLGSPDCGEVGDVLEGWDEIYDARVRARLNRHIGSCEHCQERRGLLLSPQAALPGIMLVPAPPELRARVRVSATAAMREDSESGEETGTGSSRRHDGAEPVPVPAMAPPLEPTTTAPPARAMGDDGSRDLGKLALFLVVTILVGLLGFSVAGRFGRLEIPEGEAAVPIAASTTTTTVPGNTTTTGQDDDVTTITEAGAATPSNVEVGTESVDFGAEETAAEFDVTNSGDSEGEISISTSNEAVVLSAGEASLAPGETITLRVSLNRDEIEEGDIAETITVAWSGGDTEIAVVGTHEDNPIIHNPQANPSEVEVDGGAPCVPTQTTVSARVRDTSPLESVVVRWNDGSNARETAMSDVGGDIFEGVIGPFGEPQTADVRIVAFDERGNAGGAIISVSVLPCP
jgi:DNA-directed RNA polymerase specialized sigma24 family protein